MTEDDKVLAVARANADLSQAVGESLDAGIKLAETRIEESRGIISRYGKTEDTTPKGVSPPQPLIVRSFEEIWAEANASNATPAHIEDLLTADEIARVGGRLDTMREDFRKIHRMDGIDYSIAGCAGLLAALVDIFLIQMPKAPGLLGGTGSKGGLLSNWIRERVNSCVPKERLSWLEREFKVPYDASVSTNLGQKIAGLSPRTHRFHALGHDPLLGWLFGVSDILKSKMSAIDKNGNFISQAIGGRSDPAEVGMSLFDAMYRMLGHLLSDVSTKAGLPAPLTSLCLLGQSKLAALEDRSLGDMGRAMYAKNYDFRHFLSMSTSPLLIEAIVRIGYFWKELASGKSFDEALPVQSATGERKPKLNSMLFTAHAIAASANAGKIAIQGGLTPGGLLSVNYPQWLALGRYSVSQALWIGYSKPKEEIGRIQSVLDSEWDALFLNTDRIFAESCQNAFTIDAV